MNNVDDFGLHENAHCIDTIWTGKGHFVRYLPIQLSPLDKSKVLLQFSGGGRVPLSGINTNGDTTSLLYTIDSHNETQGLARFNRAAVEMAMANKSWWWPEGINNDQIKENFASIFRERRQDERGNCPASMTTHVQFCDITDTTGQDLSYTHLPGRHWDRIVVQVTGFYFAGKHTWGVNKQLVKLVIV
jgi:hypothetical protein